MYHKLEADLRSRGSHNIAWTGRINLVKMTILPRMRYLFRSLPIPIRWDHLKAFQSKITLDLIVAVLLLNLYGIRMALAFRAATNLIFPHKGGWGFRIFYGRPRD